MTHPTPAEVHAAIAQAVQSKYEALPYDPSSPDHLPVWVWEAMREGLSTVVKEHRETYNGT